MSVQAWMFWRSKSGQRRGPTRVACLVRNLQCRRSCLQQPAGLRFLHTRIATSLAVCCATSRAWQSFTEASCAGKRPRMALAEEDAGRGDVGDDGPSTSGRDSNGATASGGVLPHRQYRGQRVETPSYPGAPCVSHCLYPTAGLGSSLCRTACTLQAACRKAPLSCAQDSSPTGTCSLQLPACCGYSTLFASGGVNQDARKALEGRRRERAHEGLYASTAQEGERGRERGERERGERERERGGSSRDRERGDRGRDSRDQGDRGARHERDGRERGDRGRDRGHRQAALLKHAGLKMILCLWQGLLRLSVVAIENPRAAAADRAGNAGLNLH